MRQMKFQLLNSFKIFVFTLMIVNANCASAHLCKSDQSKTDCSKSLINYPLFDTPYKLHANYLPILALRALAHGDIYKEKKDFKLERLYYVRNTRGAFQEPYSKLIGTGKVEGHGFIGRKISFEGKLDDFDIHYVNKMSFSLPKKAKMNIEAKIDDISFLKLEIHSDADTMTNDVEGTYFGQVVDYNTEHRDSRGKLAGHPYHLHTEGKVKEDTEFYATTDGSIAGYSVQGSASLVGVNEYLTVEHYGPIMVKTFVTIL